MPQDSWVACRQEYDQLVSLLLDNRGYVIQEVLSEEYNDMEEREPSKAGDRVALPGSLIGIFENIDNEASPLSATESHTLLTVSSRKPSNTPTPTSEEPSTLTD